MIHHALAGLALVAGLAAPLAAADLSVGDKAPLLEGADWLQGDAVPAYESGRLYVLDFWATWCGPCIQSIPHLNELSQDLAEDVTFIGVAIWPREGMKPTTDFLREQGDKMSYTIAADVDGQLAKSFMEAAGQGGIPTAMVVDRSGTLVWVGHPMDGLDGVLEEILDGSFDSETFAAEQAEQAAAKEKGQALFVELNQAMQSEDWESVHELAGNVADLHPMFAGVRSLQYGAVLELKDWDRAGEVGRQIVESTNDAEIAGPVLGQLAFIIVSPQSRVPDEHRDLELALLAASKANELTEGEDAILLDVLARAHFVNGNVEEAVEFQQLAVDRAEEEGQRSEYGARLAEYEAALS